MLFFNKNQDKRQNPINIKVNIIYLIRHNSLGLNFFRHRRSRFSTQSHLPEL